MREGRRSIRLATLLILVAGCALVCGLGVNLYRAFSPVRRWIRESRPGHSLITRREAVLNLSYRVPATELENAFPFVLAAAKDPDPTIRTAAVSALRRRSDHFAEVFPVLMNLMKDPDPRVRESAIFHLEMFVTRGSPELSTLIRRWWLRSTTPSPRSAWRPAARSTYSDSCRGPCPRWRDWWREEEGSYRMGALGFLMLNKPIPKEIEPTLRDAREHGEFRAYLGSEGPDPARHLRSGAGLDHRGHGGEPRPCRAYRGGRVTDPTRPARASGSNLGGVIVRKRQGDQCEGRAPVDGGEGR